MSASSNDDVAVAAQNAVSIYYRPPTPVPGAAPDCMKPFHMHSYVFRESIKDPDILDEHPNECYILREITQNTRLTKSEAELKHGWRWTVCNGPWLNIANAHFVYPV